LGKYWEKIRFCLSFLKDQASALPPGKKLNKILVIPFLKNDDCLGFPNFPGRGDRVLRPYKKTPIIFCIFLRKWYKN
jgi:hypothetical protein